MEWSRHEKNISKNSKGQRRLKSKSTTAAVGIYFFLVVLAVTFTLALIR
tara:strand:+ start:1231 stop:1377 length:147 start_codon:yes stop_codon:yes gene_type:complete